MARKAVPADKPDAITYKDEDHLSWQVTCCLCPRTLMGEWVRDAAYRKAVDHLKYTHGLDRIWIDVHPHGYKQMVQDALPLIVAHDMQVASEYRR